MRHLAELWREGAARAEAEGHEQSMAGAIREFEGQAGGTHAWGEEGGTEGVNRRRGRETGEGPLD